MSGVLLMENQAKVKRGFMQNFFASPWFFFLIILVLALFIRLIVIFAFGGESYRGDAALYKERADNLLDGKVPYRDFIDPKPPLLLLTIAFWFFITGSSSVLSIKIFFSLFDLICIAIGYFYLKDRVSNKFFLHIFLLMIALNPIIFANSAYYGRHYILPATLLMISLFTLKNGEEIKSAIIMGIAIMYTYLSALFLPPFLLNMKSKKSLIKYMTITLTTVLVILSPFIYLAGEKYFDNTVLEHTESGARGFSVWKIVSEISGITSLEYNIPFLIQAIFLTIITALFIFSCKFSLKKRGMFCLEVFTITFYLTFILLNKHVLLQYFVIPAVFFPILIILLKTDKIPFLKHMITFYLASWVIFLVYRLEYEYFKEMPNFVLGGVIIYLAALIPLIFLLFSKELKDKK